MCCLIVFFMINSCKADKNQNRYLTILKSDTLTNYHVLEKQFLIGSHLCRKPMPDMAELKHDMRLLKKNGFNYIKLQTHWALDEPSEGSYDFSDYEELIKYAGEIGLQVYVGLTIEQAPGWLWEKYPDCRMIEKNGLPVSYEAAYVLPSDGKPGPCFDSKGAREAMVRYIKALVNRLGKYKNIGMWNTWQEIVYNNVCYCHNTQEHFREWLKTRYISLDSLNKNWCTAFTGWKNIKPNMGNPIGTRQDIDWKYFMEHIHAAQTLQTRAEAIRSADPYKRPVFAHRGTLPTIGSGRDWTYARCQDFFGTSVYPCSNAGPFHPWDDGSNDDPKDKFRSLTFETNMDFLALNLDYCRCANPKNHPVIGAEFQGGPILYYSSGFNRGRFPDAEDIRRWMFTAVGSGITGISFWVTRLEIAAQEGNSFGLLDSRGDSTERFYEAGRIARVTEPLS